MVSALSLAAPYLADALVLLGILVMTLGVYGVIRMPDTYTRRRARRLSWAWSRYAPLRW